MRLRQLRKLLVTWVCLGAGAQAIIVGADDLKTLLVPFIPEGHELQLGRVPHVEVSSLDEVRVDNVQHQMQSAVLQGDVLFQDINTKESKRLPFYGKLVVKVKLPVLVRPISPGEIILEEDVTLVETTQSVHMGQAPMVVKVDDLVRKTPRRMLSPHQPVRTSDIESPLMVKRGDLVRVVYESGPIRLTTMARALQDGRHREVISLQGHSSDERNKKTIVATVVGTNQAQIKEQL